MFLDSFGFGTARGQRRVSSFGSERSQLRFPILGFSHETEHGQLDQ